MLSVEYDSVGDTVRVHGDPAGLLALAERLQRLIARTPLGGADHDHLMTPAWGGSDLVGEPQSADAQTVHHLKVLCWRTGEIPDTEPGAPVNTAQ